ncbi:MAG: ACT domain-containing protein [Oscillospiraceae bacterium]|nr:ACT domain-containing protein [Oscillospiraceae bacterium]MBQ9930561.1 ACT domain-containing protein [Oscillospiraceae bacterium]
MVYQISVFLENRAGQLAEITSALADNGIDLRAMSIAETADYGILRMIVDDAQKATAVLMEHEYLLTMTPVLVVSVPDVPGGIAPVLETLAEGDIDIEYMYSLFTHTGGKAYIVFRVGEAEKFVSLLATHGITPTTADELGIH